MTSRANPVRTVARSLAGCMLLCAVACAGAGAPISATPSVPAGSIHNLVAPNLVGDTKPQAEEVLSSLGVVSVSIDHRPGTSSQAGTVISQVPAPDHLISTATGIDLVIASGSPGPHAGPSGG